MAHSARLDQRVLAILDPHRRRDPVGSRFAIILPCVVGMVCSVLGGVTLTTALSNRKSADRNPGLASRNENADPVWKENYTVEYPGTLPVSVAFSADGKTLLTGDTGGEIMALRSVVATSLAGDGSLKSRDRTQRSLSPRTRRRSTRRPSTACASSMPRSGTEEARIEANDSNPTAIGVFPNEDDSPTTSSGAKIVFGNPRGYFVKSWVEGKLPKGVSRTSQ